jgi:hypothetical protein
LILSIHAGKKPWVLACTDYSSRDSQRHTVLPVLDGMQWMEVSFSLPLMDLR